ncbi:tetratricopeptide repeat protein [Actinomadura sp. KC216]|uniref:tetratricopeptide repeat protein n=1 Tax=Actinomadura sp. KC216 TaxID=2530370 RepID=UPI0014047723|nr:tetratricopeptide repeat protein [Actinomadura sp. KC216]
MRRSTEVLGENARSTLGVAYNFAIDLYTLGDLETARAMVEEIHARRCEVLGVEHPDTLNSAGIMAGHLSESGQVEAARTQAEDTLDMCRHALGEDHPQTLLVARSLALYLRELHETAKARRLEAETLERYRAVLGEEHPDTAAMAARVAAHRNAVEGAGNGAAADRTEASEADPGSVESRTHAALPGFSSPVTGSGPVSSVLSRSPSVRGPSIAR